MISHPDTINPTGPHVYHYIRFFDGIVGNNSMGVPVLKLMAVINYANATLPFVVAAFPAL